MALPPPARDRTCLVTGASSGIGREIAHKLAQRGYGVTLVARRDDRLRAVADELAGAHHVRAEVIRRRSHRCQRSQADRRQGRRPRSRR